jgi:hypothetical protein
MHYRIVNVNHFHTSLALSSLRCRIVEVVNKYGTYSAIYLLVMELHYCGNKYLLDDLPFLDSVSEAVLDVCPMLQS